MAFEIQQPPYRVTDDRAAVDVTFVCKLLATSYWAGDRPAEVIAASWRSPAIVPFTVLFGDQPVGFARVVTDRLTFGWLADVMVDPAHRGKGLGKLIVRAVSEYPDLQGHVRMLLATKDAHGLYEQVGFVRREMMWRNPPTSVDPLKDM